MCVIWRSVVIFITSCPLALVATNFKIIDNKNPPFSRPARIMHHKILIFNIVCFQSVPVCVWRLWDFKYLKMNYINMHKFSFKWAQLTFSSACCRRRCCRCSVSLLLVYIFIVQSLLLFLYFSTLLLCFLWRIRKLRCELTAWGRR